jgi:phosphate transport system permease protein
MVRRRKDQLFRFICVLAAGIAVLLLVILLYKIFADGASKVDWDFIKGNLSRRAAKTGIWPAIVGSLYVMALTAAIALPLGIAAAIYLEEFTRRKNRFARFIQINIANLAGVPSIVYGLLGLAVFNRWLALGASVYSGALTMALLILPMVIIVTQEALRSVPSSYRDGSLALGSTPWQAIRYQVIPNAMPGILTGIILSISRAIGETAPLIAVGAATYVTDLPSAQNPKYTALPIVIFDWAKDPRKGFPEAAAGAIVVLIVSLLLLNSVAIIIRARARRLA